MHDTKNIKNKLSKKSWRDNVDQLLSDYKQNGYVVVDNFIDESVAEEVNSLFKSDDNWEDIDQVRETHYQHVFKTESPFLPGEDEAYLAKFGRSTSLEKSDRIQTLYDQFFKPALSEVTKTLLSEFDIRCYRMNAGDFYRTHIDDYAGSVGCIYYINKKWIWDWGGILHVSNKQDDAVTSILPKFNRAVIIDHGKFRFPHFISIVSDYAKNPRYTIVSFNK